MKNKIEFEVNLVKGSVTVEDQWLGKRVINSKIELIRDQLKLLNHYRHDGRRPSKHLLDDIKVYEFILKSDAPEKFADDYLLMQNQIREEKKSSSIKKMDVARRLGWEIK